MTANTPTLRGRVHQNLYLPVGTGTVQALITVDAVADDDAAAPPPQAAVAIVIDTSTSMRRADKMRHAIAATTAAIDELRDGVEFALIAGTFEADMVYPPEPGTVRACDATREAAREAARTLTAEGGTRMGRWLELVRTVLAAHPAAVRHAILLTDGRNQHETDEELAAVVEACAGTFRCDCRGVGDDWLAPQLRLISRGLVGSFDRIPEPSRMADDLRAVMAESMGRRVAEVALRVWAPSGARVDLVKQTAPGGMELTSRRYDDGERVGLYPTGPWGSEQRDFHVAITVPLAAAGQERLAGHVSFVRTLPDGGTEPLEQAFVRSNRNGGHETHPAALVSAIWTDDPNQDTAPHPLVLLSTGQAGLEQAVDRAAAAYRAGDPLAAGEWLDEVRTRAAEAGLPALVERIDALRDPRTGTYRLDDGELLEIEIESSGVPLTPRDDLADQPVDEMPEDDSEDWR